MGHLRRWGRLVLTVVVPAAIVACSSPYEKRVLTPSEVADRDRMALRSLELFPFARVGEAMPLPTHIGGYGGDWDLPSYDGLTVTWRLAEGDRDLATLENNVLTGLKPGGVRLIGQAGAYRLWYLQPIVADDVLFKPVYSENSPTTLPTPSPGPTHVVQDTATWTAIWKAAFSPKGPTGAPAGQPTWTPTAPTVPPIDFTTRSLLFATVDVHPHTNPPRIPIVTHREGAVLHLATPELWLPDEAPWVPVRPGEPVGGGWSVGPTTYVFNLPKLPDAVSIEALPFEAP